MAKRKKVGLLTKNSALLVVDVQNDFCPGGKLPVPCGNEVVEPLNRFLKEMWKLNRGVWISLDWHPRKTGHFSKYNKNGKGWPVHCVKETKGAELHPKLNLNGHFILVLKGTKKDEDGYSDFDGMTNIGLGFPGLSGRTLEKSLKNHQIKRLFVGGLATDYCVKFTVLDALKLGFEVYVLEDAIRAVNVKPGDGERAIEEMRKAGAIVTTTKEVLG